MALARAVLRIRPAVPRPVLSVCHMSDWDRKERAEARARAAAPRT